MSLRIALLGLLARYESASGYDLAKSIDRSITHIWHARHSQVYPELVKMHRDGAIRVQEEGPRGRKIYTLTEHGDTELRAWLLTHEPDMSMRNEWALQAFLLPLLEPDQALAVLDRMKKLNRASLDHLEGMEQELRETFRTKPRALGKYALDLGIRHGRLMNEWVEDTATAIRATAEAGTDAEDRADAQVGTTAEVGTGAADGERGG